MRDHCNGDRSLEAVLLARRGLMAADVRSTRDWPTEGLRVFAEEEEDRRKEEVVLLGGKAVLHSTLLKPPERVGSRINAGTARQREGGVSTVGRQRKHQSNSPRSLCC